MDFGKAIEKIREAIVDVMELEVVTLTGNIKASLKADSIDVDWDTLHQKVSNDTLQIVAITKLKLDGDAIQFQTNEDIPHRNDLLLIHNETLKASLAGRAAVTQLLSSRILKG